MTFPATRMRRLRANEFSRRLMRETTLTVDDIELDLASDAPDTGLE